MHHTASTSGQHLEMTMNHAIDGHIAAIGWFDQPADTAYDRRLQTVGVNVLQLQMLQEGEVSCWPEMKLVTMLEKRYACGDGPIHWSFAGVWIDYMTQSGQLRRLRVDWNVTSKSQLTNTIHLVDPFGVGSQSDDRD